MSQGPTFVAGLDVGLSVPFPLREGFIATVYVPRDMTTQEAERLAAMVKTLTPPTPATGPSEETT